jgi:hypothetical protein
VADAPRCGSVPISQAPPSCTRDRQFNAGTLGAAMVEGRTLIVVGDQSDIGGGSSIMGTLSGGGKNNSIGRRCLSVRTAGSASARRRLRRRGRHVTAGTIVRPRAATRKAWVERHRAVSAQFHRRCRRARAADPAEGLNSAPLQRRCRRASPRWPARRFRACATPRPLAVNRHVVGGERHGRQIGFAARNPLGPGRR